MLRRIAQFALWVGLFGLFLFAAAYSTGNKPLDLLFISLGLVGLSALILRRPRQQFEASHRFRTLRRLGLTGRPPDKS